MSLGVYSGKGTATELEKKELPLTATTREGVRVFLIIHGIGASCQNDIKEKKMNTLHPASFSSMEPPALLESHL